MKIVCESLPPNIAFSPSVIARFPQDPQAPNYLEARTEALQRLIKKERIPTDYQFVEGVTLSKDGQTETWFMGS
jgi:hypothetical protein